MSDQPQYPQAVYCFKHMDGDYNVLDVVDLKDYDTLRKAFAAYIRNERSFGADEELCVAAIIASWVESVEAK